MPCAIAGLIVYLATYRRMRRLSFAPDSPRAARAARFILCGRLPRAAEHLADAPHRLAVARDDRDGAQVVEDVLGGDGLAADAALGEGDVLGIVGSRW
jgi:hypothetical protein